jgi:parallel beta-helix repeat protein
MSKNAALDTTIILTLLVLYLFQAGNVKISQANFFPDKPPEAIYIRGDGTVEPATAPITRVGDLYTFTGNINQPIVVEKDNIVVDGAGLTLRGEGDHAGIEMSMTTNVTITNIRIKSFLHGIFSYNSNNNIIKGNTVTESNYTGINLIGASKCIISNNTVESNTDGIRCTGTTMGEPSLIEKNTIRFNSNVGIYTFNDTILNGNVVESNAYNYVIDYSPPTPEPTRTPSPEQTPEPEPFPTTLVIASVVAVVAVVGLGLLVYLKKHKG